MTLTDLLTEARAILPGEKLSVQQHIGEPYGWPWSIGIHEMGCYSTAGGGNTPEEALEAVRKFQVSRKAALNDTVEKARANLRRLESLQQQTTEGK